MVWDSVPRWREVQRLGRFVLGTHACTAELGRDLIRQRQAEGIAVKRNHGGNVGGRPRVADAKADAAVKLYIARETPIPDICARLGLAQKWEEFTGAPCATGTLAV